MATYGCRAVIGYFLPILNWNTFVLLCPASRPYSVQMICCGMDVNMAFSQRIKRVNIWLPISANNPSMYYPFTKILMVSYGLGPLDRAFIFLIRFRNE